MKRKPQRYSFKKLTSFGRKQDGKFLSELKDSCEKHTSHCKNRSSEKVIPQQESGSKFKISKNNADRLRVRTEFDEFTNTKSPFQKLLTLSKKDKDDRIKSKPSDKVKSFIETKHLNLKKLHINSDQYDSGKGNPDTPHSGKHYSFRKAYESQRSGPKKTALEKYVSESLENLEMASKKAYPNSKQNQLKNTIKKHSDESIPKQAKSHTREKRIFEQFIKEIDKQDRTPKVLQERGTSRRLRTQKDESIQKIEIKWQKKKKNPYELSKQQMDIFGDRFPDGFDKIKLLGRGGFSLVWLGEHKKSKKKYAIKQIITESSHQTHLKQIWFGTYFFEFGGAPKEQFASCPGIKHLVKLYYYFINKKDTWILYEKCGDSLGNSLYELKSEYFNSEKLYRINYKEFYSRVRNNQNELRSIILDVAKALELLADNNIVHSDLKTENILIRLKNQEELKINSSDSHILEVKLIDYGSSFVFTNLRQFSMATPEYMAPQILNFILYENEFEYIPKLLQYVQKYTNPWVIDIWSLGCVILEIVSGIPLWMSLKTIVTRKSIEAIKYGLFAIKGRAFDKIIKKQLDVVQNLDKYLSEENYSQIVLQDDLKVLLRKMLSLNPAKRISPAEIIEFLSGRPST